MTITTVRPQPGGDNKMGSERAKTSNTEGISGKNKVKNVKTVGLLRGRSEKRWDISDKLPGYKAERRMDGR